MGIQSGATNNLLTLSSPAILNNAIANNLSDVQNLFTNSTDGLATGLAKYLKSMNGPDGVLANDESNMSKDSSNLTNSITKLNQQIASEQTELTNQFTAMETAINTINTQKEYLNAYFSSSSTASSNAAPTAAGSSINSSSSSSSSG